MEGQIADSPLQHKAPERPVGWCPPQNVGEMGGGPRESDANGDGGAPGQIGIDTTSSVHMPSTDHEAEELEAQGRKANGVVDFLANIAGPPVEVESSDEDLKTFLREIGDATLELEALNKRFRVIRNYYGKVVVAELADADEYTLHSLKVQTPDDFKKGYAHIKYKIDGRLKSIGQIWWDWPARRQYERVVFKPQIKEASDELNLWKGFSVKPKDGNCEPILEFLEIVACNSVNAHYKYLMNLLALGVQKPWLRWSVVIVCRSEVEGTGKGTFAKFYGDLFGEHYMLVSDINHLVGDFNGHLINKLLIFADEVDISGRNAMKRFKSLVTEPNIYINPKGFPAVNEPNRLKFIIASNDDHAVLASRTARRLFCLDFAKSEAKNLEYFEKLHRFYEMQGGKQAFLYHLLHRDIDNFNAYAIPETQMLRQQKEKSLRIEEKAVLYMLDEEELPELARNNTCSTREIMDHLDDKFPRLRDVTVVMLTRVLKQIGCEKRREGGTGRAVWTIPGVEEMRNAWDRHYGPREWPTLQVREGGRTNDDRPTPY